MASAKKQFNNILKLTQSQISYKSISQKLNEILEKGEEERTEQLKNYYSELVKDVFRSGIQFRIEESNKPTFRGRFADFNKVHGKTLAKDVGAAFKQMIAEKKPELLKTVGEKIQMNAQEVRDIVTGVAHEFNALDGVRRNGREQNINRLIEHMDDLFRGAKKRKNPAFNPESTDSYHVNIAEAYITYKEKMAQYEKMMQRNPVWRFFNRGLIKKFEHFINTSAELMAMADFDTRTHGPMIESRFASEPYSFLKFQIDQADEDVATEKFNNAAIEKAKNTVQLTVARDKYKNAEKLNENKETSIISKWQPYIEKYGLHVGANGIDANYSGYKNAAETFDRQREIGALAGCIKQRFLGFCLLATGGSLRKNGTVNPKEILKDVQEMVDIELKHCTVVYDHPEAKSIADNNVYANLSHEIIQRKMKESITFYNKTAEVKISEEKINEIMETIKSTVTTDREANKKRLESLAENEKNNEIVQDADNKKQENIVVNEDEQRKPVSINLENDNAAVETSAKIEEPAIPSIQKEAAQK